MADRIYKYAKDVLDIIDNAQYENGDPVACDPIVSTITIFNWDQVKTSDQALINAAAIAHGFHVV